MKEGIVQFQDHKDERQQNNAHSHRQSQPASRADRCCSLGSFERKDGQENQIVDPSTISIAVSATSAIIAPVQVPSGAMSPAAIKNIPTAIGQKAIGILRF